MAEAGRPAEEPLPRATGEAGSRPVARVVQGYAQLLQESLGRDGRAPWVLGGLALYDDLAALQHSLTRCLQMRETPSLRHWHDVLTRLLPGYAADVAEVHQGQAWVTAIRHILDTATLPTREQPGPGGDAVARQLAHTLGGLAEQTSLSPWLTTLRQHLWAVSERYWRGLFVCYDLVGLPRTTNELESRFGQTKRRIRRQSGLQQLRHPLQRQGAWLLYQSQAKTVTELHHRLTQVPREAYHAERTRWEARQDRFRQRYRWRHHRAAVLAQLEAAWASEGLDSS